MNDHRRDEREKLRLCFDYRQQPSGPGRIYRYISPLSRFNSLVPTEPYQQPSLLLWKYENLKIHRLVQITNMMSSVCHILLQLMDNLIIPSLSTNERTVSLSPDLRLTNQRPRSYLIRHNLSTIFNPILNSMALNSGLWVDPGTELKKGVGDGI